MRTAENEIDMEKICDILKDDYKVTAYVEQTGGGCATIMAGEVRDDEGHYQACAGPGWFRGPGWQHGVGDLGDFSVGFDDDGETESIFSQKQSTTWNENDVARILAGIVNGNIEEHATAYGTLPFYPDPNWGAFYTAAGNHVGELVAWMNEDGSMDPESITEIIYEEA